MIQEVPGRPAMMWAGGKWAIAPWVIEHFPEHETYIEPYGGAASVLFRKPRSKKEIYNDLDDRVVNLFRCFRDPELSKRLEFLLWNTPYSRTEYYSSGTPSDDPVESARRLLVKSFQGWGTSGTRTDKPSSFLHRHGRVTLRSAKEWRTWPRYHKEIFRFRNRLQGVIIESLDALELIRKYDYEDALFYADPPYLHSTRRNPGDYKYEMSDEDHENLLDVLASVKDMVVLSGYNNDLYMSKLKGWKTDQRSSKTAGNNLTTETLFINSAALKRLPQDLANSMEPIL